MGVKITNTSGEPPKLWIYGTIGDEFGGVTIDDVRNALAEIPRTSKFEVRIFSDGGSFDTAMAIHSHLAARRDKTHGIVDGLAASAGSLLLQATGRRSMAKHSRQMIHEVHGSIRGSLRAREFRAIADQMDATNRELVSIYSRQWKGSEEDLLTALADDTWLSADQSVEVGLADDVIDGPSIAARVNSDLFTYDNVPADVILAGGAYETQWAAELEQVLEELGV